MAQLQKQAVANYRLGTIEDFREIRPFANMFNTNSDQASKRLYFADFPTKAVVATGTVVDSNTQPILARKYEPASIYKYDQAGRPVSVKDTVSQAVTATAANDGAEFSGITFSVTDDYVCFTVEDSVTAVVDIQLQTDDTNYRSFAFDTTNITADSNGFKRLIAQNLVGTYTNVTVSDTGTFNPSSITKVEVQSDTAGTFTVYDIQSGLNPEVFLGHQLSLTFDCIDEATWNDTLELADRKCGLYTVGKSATGLTLDITLKVRELNGKSQAAARGEVLKRGQVSVPVIQNASAGGRTAESISAGAMTIIGLDAQRIAVVRANNFVLDRVETAGDVTDTTYHYNASTGVFTFSTSFNGVTPTIILMEAQTGTYFDRKNLKTGFVGPLTVTRVADTGKTVVYDFPAAEITGVEMTQEDSEVSHTYTLTVTPFEEGNQFRYFRQIEI